MRWLKISFFGSSFVPNSSLKASCIIIISRFEESLSNPLHTLRMVRGSQLSLILLQSYCKFVFEACEMILYIKSLLQRRCFTLQFQFCRLSFHNIYGTIVHTDIADCVQLFLLLLDSTFVRRQSLVKHNTTTGQDSGIVPLMFM